MANEYRPTIFVAVGSAVPCCLALNQGVLEATLKSITYINANKALVIPLVAWSDVVLR